MADRCAFVRFDSGCAVVCDARLLKTGMCVDMACPNQPMMGPRCDAARYETGVGLGCGAATTEEGRCTDSACSKYAAGTQLRNRFVTRPQK